MTFYTFGKWLVKWVMKVPYKLTVSSMEELPQDRGFILACNHISSLDPVMLGIACPRRVSYMAKQELFRIPVLGFLIRQLGAFPVSRGKGDTTAINTAIEIVKAGGVLGIFPEGGRSRDGKFHKVKSGTVVVASQTNADIVPACIVWGERRWFRRRPVEIKFGPVIENAALGITDHSKTELRAANALLGSRIAELLGVEAP